MKINWVDNSTISTRIEDGAVVLSANKEGLFSLARIIVDMASADINDHIHLDENNSLEDGSVELIIERID